MKKIFLSYAREDKFKVERVYLELKHAGLNPWMDKPPTPYDLSGIVPGADWDTEVRKQLKEAALVLAFLSKKSTVKEGYIQKEFRLALSYLMEKPQDRIYLIPILLEDCRVPNFRVDSVSLEQLQWYKLYEDGVPLLIEYLKVISAETSENIEQQNTSADLEKISFVNRIKVLENQLFGQIRENKSIQARYITERNQRLRQQIEQREGRGRRR